MLAEEKKVASGSDTVKAAQVNPVCNDFDDDAPFVRYIVQSTRN